MTTQDQGQDKRFNTIDRVVQLYGDLLFDLCESILWSSSSAQSAFQVVLKEIRQQSLRQAAFEHYERAWVLRIACEKLRILVQKQGRRLSPSEQIMLDATLDNKTRLEHFDSYFHRLPTEDQFLLLFRDKYGLPYSEIASAMALPEGSLKTKRQQAFRALEEWLWPEQAPEQTGEQPTPLVDP